MKLYVKNMVCNRCITTIKEILQNIKLHYFSVQIGEIDLHAVILPHQQNRLFSELQKKGFELVNFEETKIMNKIHESIHALVHNTTENPNFNLSIYLFESTRINYHTLNDLFADIKGISLEQYFTCNKIDRVIYMIKSDGLNLTQIAQKMNYPHISHLLDQFKENTGLSPIILRSILFPKINKSQNLH